MFFASADQVDDADKYALLRRASRMADERGFCAVWTPERHFHKFGGLFPNPAITSAALASITSRIQLRAGSVVAPLHHTVRLAEDWAVVDNLSGGRVALSFGSGWNADDFVLAPERYATRQAVMYEQIETMRRLWRGESITLTNSFGREVPITLTPAPVQPELPTWVTSSGNPKTFESAGAIGANVLTHLMGQDLLTLGRMIEIYRRARREHGFDPEKGIVSLMLHTCIGVDDGVVRAKVKGPLSEYLRSAVTLEQRSAASGGFISGGHTVEAHDIPDAQMADLLDAAFERYYDTASLLGTPQKCRELVWKLAGLGVNELACLIDFGLPDEDVLESLELVDALRASCSPAATDRFTTALAQEFSRPLE